MINNMSNYTIKAKNKKTGEIVDIKIIDKGNYFQYLWRKPIMEKEVIGYIDNIYGYDEFNDLFEVVENNKSKCCNKPVHVLPNGVICPTFNNGCGEYCDVIPQTDTLKKEDWEELNDLFKVFDEYFDLKSKTRQHGIYTQVMLKAFKHFITQEIAKAKEEIIEDVKYSKLEHKEAITKMLLKTDGKIDFNGAMAILDTFSNDIINLIKNK